METNKIIDNVIGLFPPRIVRILPFCLWIWRWQLLKKGLILVFWMPRFLPEHIQAAWLRSKCGGKGSY